MKNLVFAVSVLVVLFSSCQSAPRGRGAGEIESAPAAQVNFRVETVVGGLQVPWSIVWTPDGRMLLTERNGNVRVVTNGKLQP